MLQDLSSQQIIMSMLWMMMTGACIWGLDNFLKRFENTMEDSFKHQARSINDGLRMNFTLLLISVSVFSYFKFYLQVETTAIKGILGNLLELVASVGHFILYLLAYIVYLGYKYLGTSYQPGQPEAEKGIFLGFILLFSYFVVKRLFFRKTPPILWAVIVASVMLAFNFISDRAGLKVEDIKLFDNQTKNKTKVAPKQEKKSGTRRRHSEGTQASENDQNDDDRFVLPEGITNDHILVASEHLETAIEEFEKLIRRTEPNEADYANHQQAYIQATVKHANDMRVSPAHDKILKIIVDYDNKKIRQHPSIDYIIKMELCELYDGYFNDDICTPSPN